jgi:hypothetical protein
VSDVSSPNDVRSQLRRSFPRTGDTPPLGIQDLTSAVSGMFDISNASQSQFIGAETEQQLRDRFDIQTQQRNLQGQLGAIDATPQASYSDAPFDEVRDAITPGTRATLDSMDSLIDDLAAGNNLGGTQRNLAAELDTDSRADGAAEINHGAAYDAVGSVDAGVLAARGGDRDPVPHMDDYGTALLEIKQLLQVLAGPQLAADSEPLESSDGPRQASAVPRAENDGDIWGRLARQSAAEDAQDADPTGILRPSNVVGDLETDESDSDEDDFGDMPSTPPAARDLRELLDAPPSADAPPGAAATSTTRKLDLVARAEAADALRRTPGIMKLIEARIFKFDDFLTDGSLDATKLAKVRRVLARRVDDTAESYALAASARGYAPSGAAYPIEGLNNIVAGVRKIPGSKYVMYQGPQYVNG